MLDPTFAAAHPIAYSAGSIGSAGSASIAPAAPAGVLSVISDGLEAFDAFLWGPWLLIPLLLGTGVVLTIRLR